MNRHLDQLKPRQLSREESEFLWQRIERRMALMPDPVVRQPSFIHRPMFAPVFLSLLLVLSASAATVAASDSAKPGDVLFPLDRAVEEVRLQLSSSADTRANLQIAFAQERLDEAEELVSNIEITLQQNAAISAGNGNQNISATVNENSNSTDEVSTAVSAKARANVTTALLAAVGYLNDVRVKASTEGNAQAVSQLDTFIQQLNGVSETDIATWDRGGARVKASPTTVKKKMKAVADDLRSKKLRLFERVGASATATSSPRLNSKNEAHGDNDADVKIKQDDDGVEVLTRVNINASSGSNTNSSVNSHINVNVNNFGAGGLDIDLNDDEFEEVKVEAEDGRTHVKVETEGGATYEFDLDVDTRAEVVAEIADALGVSTAEVKSVLEFKVK